MGANEARHVLALADDLGKVLGLELYTAAQALDLRRDMINAARALARQGSVEDLAAKIGGAPAPGGASADTFLEEVDGLRRELAESAEFRPGRAVGAAHRAIRRSIDFLGFDRAMDADVQKAVRLVTEGHVLTAARQAEQGDDLPD